MRELRVILCTASQIEADVIKGLLETHGIDVLITSNLSRTAFPFSSNELRLSVSEEEAERATSSSDGGAGRQCSRTQSRIIGSAKL